MPLQNMPDPPHPLEYDTPRRRRSIWSGPVELKWPRHPVLRIAAVFVIAFGCAVWVWIIRLWWIVNHNPTVP